MDNDQEISRLRKAYDYLRYRGDVKSQMEVALKMSAAPVTVSRAFTGNEKYFTRKFLRRFNHAFDETFNMEWLMHGTGDMLNYKKETSQTENDHNWVTNRSTEATPHHVPEVNEPDKEEEVYLQTKNGMKYYERGKGKFMLRVPLVPYDAYARFSNDFQLQPDRDEWEEVDFEVDRIGHGNYMAFNVRGDSMDDGTRKSFAQGEVVLVRELERIHWKDGLRINRYPYWVIAFDNSILVKEITEQNLETGDIVCHSLNSSPEYRDFSINLDNVHRLFNIIKKKTPDTVY